MNHGPLVLVGRQLAIVVVLDRDGAMAARCVEAVEAHEPLDALLAALLREGPRRLPGFACVHLDGEWMRVLVRGAVGVRAEDELLLASPDIGTWREELRPRSSVTFVVEGDLLARWIPATGEAMDQLLAPRPTTPARQEPGPPEPEESRDGAGVEDAGAGPISPKAPPPAEAGATVLANTDDQVHDRLAPLPPPVPVAPASPGAFPPPTRSGATPQHTPPQEPATGAAAEERDDEPSQPAPPTPARSPSGLISSVPLGDDPPPAQPADAGAPPGRQDAGATVLSTPQRPADGDRDEAATSADHLGLPAVHCAQGHPNPPQSGHCRICTLPVAGRAITTVARPVIARLRFSDGSAIELDRPQVIGRQPTAPDDGRLGEAVGLHAVADPERELSRNHLEIRLDGWSITAVDLGSRNGTWLQNPDQEPVRLRPGEPSPVLLGATVRLAEVAAFDVVAPS